MWKCIKTKEKVQAHIEDKLLVKEYTETFNNKLECSNEEEKIKKLNAIDYERIRMTLGQYKIDKAVMGSIIKNLKSNRASGYSGTSNELYKHGGETLITTVSALMEKMINISHIPKEMNVGLIFPIIKDAKKSHTAIDNTRPITLSETMAIIYEKLIMKEIEVRYQDNDTQFGFKAKSSINHAIFTLRETMIWYKNRAKTIHACFIDFSKAFDKVNRNILLRKLVPTLDGKIWASLFEYYEKSSIRVRLNSSTSEPIKTTIGVKQGGPLSPKLFTIYVDELTRQIAELDDGCNINDINTSTILYADDTVLLFETKKGLQKALDTLQEYCKKHEIRINTGKTKYFTTCRYETGAKIRIDGKELESVEKFKYLGWWLEKSLGNKEHLKARKFASLIASYQISKIGFKSATMDTELKVTLRDTYCRSRMNFALENTFLYQKDYNDLNTIECKILKNALGLRKYHSNTLINNALGITPIERLIKIRKLNFVIELLNYELTSTIVEQLMSENRKIPNKSLIKEVLTIIDDNNTNIEDIRIKAKKKVSELEEITNIEYNSKASTAIRYLLNKKNPSAREIANNLLIWSNNQAHRAA
jgi:hypothetical protein